MLSCGLLAGILIALDQSALVQNYTYTGMGNASISSTRAIVTIGGAILIGGLLPGASRLPAALAIWPLGLLVALPALVITPSRDPYWWLGTTIPLVGLAVLLGTVRSRYRFSAPPGLSLNVFIFLLTGLVVSATGVVVASYGISPAFTSLENMYSVRAEFELRTSGGSPLAAYASGWLVNVLAPSLTGLGVLWRRYALSLIGTGSLLVHYLAVPSKLVILLPIIAALLALYLRKKFRLIGPASIAVALSVLILLVRLIFPEPGNNIFAILVYRSFYVPLDVSLMWIGYFSNNPYGNFSDSLPLFDSVHDSSLPKLMSTVYGSGRGNFNANLWADGFGNFGLWGVVVVSLILGVVLTVANTLAEGRDIRACVLIFLGPSVALLNNALSTTLLSGGLAIAVLLIALLPRSSISLGEVPKLPVCGDGQ